MSSRQRHFWLVAMDEDGKPYLIYGGLTEDLARQKGLELLSGLDFKIKNLPTRDQAMASSMLKGQRLEESHSLKQASRRLGHEKSLRQKNRRTKLERW